MNSRKKRLITQIVVVVMIAALVLTSVLGAVLLWI